MSTITKLSRRGFLHGLILGIAVLDDAKLEAQFAGGAPQGPPPTGKPEAYIHIGTDDVVTFMIPKAEMGQGTVTSLSMILAEELDCDWRKVRTEFPPVDPALYGPQQGVVGSMSVRTLWNPLRTAGATARAMVIEAAARQWGVDRGQCRTENGFVINTGTNARLSYGAVAEAAAKLPVPGNVRPKDPKDFKLIGKSLKRLDTPAKISGRAQFGIDTRLPGMVYAVVARCPVFGGSVARFDASKTLAVPGVKDVFPISTGVTVIADNTWSAMEGRRVLAVTWNEGPNAAVDSAAIRRMFAARAGEPGATARAHGDAPATLAAASRRHEAVYEAPFLSHAPMEPMNCTAVVHADSCEIWASTQMQTPSRDYAAQVLGLPPEKVKVNTLFMGGGFGRRARVDYVGETVEIAKKTQLPVKLTWTREDDMQHDYYRPASYVKFAAALDNDGWPTALTADVACPPFPTVVNGLSPTAVQGIEDLRYEIPHFRTDYHVANTHVPVSYWRSVGHSQNGFFVESFIDELAAASGKDPVEFRRKLLAGVPRMLGALNLAAEKAGWGKPPAGRYQGVAVINNIGSYNAQVAEISVNQGKLRVHRIVCAVDCGHRVNPAIIQQQIEGAIVYGLTAALKGEITIDRGRVQQTNFNNYEVLRLNEMPAVEVYLVPSTEAPGGIGEAGVPAIAPAIANAVFAATGKRLRKLPIRDADIA
ncbi:MAG TPA: xanthine dehydrogenase family protein molybdopterin-binding subunit [Bryobacteraceae bacterium]|nr:xanthine dehydrogenase family protein molybdopterin-binding subunit [Bryobacteraceae bacterium]